MLREEGILILSGGLTAHNLADRSSFSPDTARAVHKEFDRAIHDAVGIDSVCDMGCKTVPRLTVNPRRKSASRPCLDFRSTKDSGHRIQERIT